MDWKSALTKLLLQIGIQALSKVVPVLGSLLGGPLGWLAGWLLGKATEYLYDWIERYLLFTGIDREILKQVVDAQAAAASLKVIQKNPTSTKEEAHVALEIFRARCRELGRLKLQ